MMGGMTDEEKERWAQLVAPLIRAWTTAIGLNTPKQIEARSHTLGEVVSHKTWKDVLDADEPVQRAKWAAMSASLGWPRSLIGRLMTDDNASPLAILDPTAAQTLQDHTDRLDQYDRELDLIFDHAAQHAKRLDVIEKRLRIRPAAARPKQLGAAEPAQKEAEADGLSRRREGVGERLEEDRRQARRGEGPASGQ